MKKAFITGINGQDGTYLAAFLRSKNYEVHGMLRREAAAGSEQVVAAPDARGIVLHYGDLTDTCRIYDLLSAIKPDEVYNLGAQSHVKASFQMPEYTAQVTGVAATRLLEAIRVLNPRIKFYQASSSEMFGDAPAPQSEQTPFRPRSPYAAAKAYAYWMTVNYREAYGMFACNGILFNHESPLRGQTFVTRKITKALAQLLAGNKQPLALGNLDALRDWGFAPEYVEAMWLMLQQHVPDDYVIGTGQSHTVRAFLEAACKYVGITLQWVGKGVEEVGIALHVSNAAYAVKPGDVLVTINPAFFRPTEVTHLQASIAKAQHKLGWQPRVLFSELVHVMMDADLAAQGMPTPGLGVSLLHEKNFSYAVNSSVL
ncbi:GDP-mannose 4,6-dehydratase [bacterium]|nr:GDP-mannose 4,6-dehydratase [bacterium]